MQHVMIDLETMGNTGDAAIIHIAAVQFDLHTGKTGLEFDAGLTPQADTILWWLGQNEQARTVLIEKQRNALTLSAALQSFDHWLSQVHTNPIVWGNSARFDLGILEKAMQLLYMKPGWKFWNEMCVRTVAALAPEVKRGTKFAGVAHNAIDDCRHQILYTVNTLRKLQGKPAVELTRHETTVLEVAEDDDLPF